MSDIIHFDNEIIKLELFAKSFFKLSFEHSRSYDVPYDNSLLKENIASYLYELKNIDDLLLYIPNISDIAKELK